MSNLVPVYKIRFGSPAFMFMRRDMDIMIREREKLKKAYADNKERVAWLGNTIRAWADLVWFAPRERRKMEAVPDAVYVTRSKPEKKKKVKRGFNENQQTMF